MNLICEQLVTIFSTAFGSTIHSYFHGQKKNVPMDDLPILMVYPLRTSQYHSGTVRDRVDYTIAVEVQINLRSYYDNTNGQGTTLDSLLALEKLVEERETDGDLKATTIMGILNANLTIGANVLYTDNMEVDYSFIDIDNTRKAKAVVTFKAHDIPNRT